MAETPSAGKGPVSPGSARRSGRDRPKGRQVEPEALAAVRALLGDRPRRRDLLIEHLHLLQERFGHLSAAHLAALAAEMRLAMAEVYEVATFYAHFDVVREGEAAPPPTTVRVCDSLSCAMAGAERLLAELRARLAAAPVRVVAGPCMGRCATAPVARLGDAYIDAATVDTVARAAAADETGPVIPEYEAYETYRAAGGYRVVEDLRAGRRAPEELIDVIEASGLRGLGGAGFPTGRKLRFVRGQPAPRYLVVNADEGEPGTFKDRYFLENHPHRFLEGMLIAASLVAAEAAYIYLRDEYPAARHILEREIARLEAEGMTGGIPIILRRGAGAYICGEESAMLESVEGKRGLPRHRPPLAGEVGLFGRPTLINNVETLYWLREILDRGAEWVADQGRNGGRGLRAYSVSGRVREPGVKIAPVGITVRELIEDHCGGMAAGHTLRAYLPGGASGGILPASLADLPLDFGALERHGAFVGSGAVIVLSDHDDLKAAALNLMRFFEDESCGQCTPCRVGTEKAVKLMARGPWQPALLGELSRAMADASICGLGQAAPNPLLSVLKRFPEEVR